MAGQAGEQVAASSQATPSSDSAAGWSETEQEIARRAFDLAQQRAIATLVRTVQAHAQSLDGVDSVWMLHDYLSIQRHSIEGRFDFRLPGLLFVFASLVRDELLTMDELAGLDPLKLAKIGAMSRI